MTHQIQPSQSQHIPRPWIVPPATIRRPDGYVRGNEIHAEVQQPLGVVLWILHRDVELWAGTDPAGRAELFSPGNLRPWSEDDVPPQLRAPIDSLLDALTSGSTDDAPAHAAAACGQIAAWAAADTPAIALLFTEAAARLDPTSAHIARRVAWYAVQCALSGAESWLKRAMALGRRSTDWAQYAGALADLGDLRAKHGERARAQRAFLRARRMYYTYRLPRSVRARAEVGLLRIALEDGGERAVEMQMRRCLRAYRGGDPRSVRMRIEVTRALIERRRFAPALRILRATDVVGTAAERFQIMSLITAAKSLQRADAAACSNKNDHHGAPAR